MGWVSRTSRVWYLVAPGPGISWSGSRLLPDRPRAMATGLDYSSQQLSQFTVLSRLIALR